MLKSMRRRIAELEMRDAELAEAEQARKLYRHLIENSLGLMCSHDLNGVLLLVNPAAAESLGYAPLRVSEGICETFSFLRCGPNLTDI